MATIENGGEILAQLMTISNQGSATEATLVAFGGEMRSFAEGTNRRLEGLEKRMGTTESKDSVQEQIIAELKEKNIKQDEAIQSLRDSVGKINIRMAIAGFVGSILGAILMILFSEWALPLLIGG